MQDEFRIFMAQDPILIGAAVRLACAPDEIDEMSIRRRTYAAGVTPYMWGKWGEQIEEWARHLQKVGAIEFGDDT